MLFGNQFYVSDITGRPMIFDDNNRADQFTRGRDQYKIDGRILCPLKLTHLKF
jgi:hypothetical protein